VNVLGGVCEYLVNKGYTCEWHDSQHDHLLVEIPKFISLISITLSEGSLIVCIVNELKPNPNSGADVMSFDLNDPDCLDRIAHRIEQIVAWFRKFQ